MDVLFQIDTMAREKTMLLPVGWRRAKKNEKREAERRDVRREGSERTGDKDRREKGDGVQKGKGLGCVAGEQQC